MTQNDLLARGTSVAARPCLRARAALHLIHCSA